MKMNEAVPSGMITCAIMNFFIPRSTSFPVHQSSFIFHQEASSFPFGNNVKDYVKYGRDALYSMRKQNGDIEKKGIAKKRIKKENPFKKSDYLKDFDRRKESIERGLDPIISLNMNLDSLARRKEKGSAERAEEMLLRIEKLYDDGYYEAKPNDISYNTVINAWANEGSDWKAERLLERMEKLYVAGNDDVKPDIISYNCVLKAFANSQKKESADKALTMLHQLKERHTAGNKDVKPDAVSYNSVINAYASLGDKKSAESACAILDEMILFSEKGDEQLKPNIRTFNTVIKAYANTIDCNISDKVDNILEKMKNLKMRPDQYTYSSIITAFAKNGKVEAAESILKTMLDLYRKGNKRMQPSKYIMTSMINAYAKVGDGPKALAILRIMEKISRENDVLMPDVVCYGALIHAFGRSNCENASNRAEQIFKEMEELYNQGDNRLKPTMHIFSALINAYSIDGLYEKAEEIFQKIKMYNMKPTRIVYNTLLKTLAKSGVKRKDKTAFAVLNEMKKSFKYGNTQASPDIISYNTAILCAAHSYGTEIELMEASEIATEMFYDAIDSTFVNPTPYTYGVYMYACRILLSEGDVLLDLLKHSFDFCCKHGMLTDQVLNHLNKSLSPEKPALSPEKLAEVIGTTLDDLSVFGIKIDNLSQLSVNQLPQEWSCKTIN